MVLFEYETVGEHTKWAEKTAATSEKEKKLRDIDLNVEIITFYFLSFSLLFREKGHSVEMKLLSCCIMQSQLTQNCSVFFPLFSLVPKTFCSLFFCCRCCCYASRIHIWCFSLSASIDMLPLLEWEWKKKI